MTASLRRLSIRQSFIIRKFMVLGRFSSAIPPIGQSLKRQRLFWVSLRILMCYTYCMTWCLGFRKLKRCQCKETLTMTCLCNRDSSMKSKTWLSNKLLYCKINRVLAIESSWVNNYIIVIDTRSVDRKQDTWHFISSWRNNHKI